MKEAAKEQNGPQSLTESSRNTKKGKFVCISHKEDIMTVYNINLGIGWASRGVELPRPTISPVVTQYPSTSQVCFMDRILADNIQHLTENIGFKNDEIIWLYSHFTDIKIAPTTYTIDQVLAGFAGKPTREEVDGKIKRFFMRTRTIFDLLPARRKQSLCRTLRVRV